MKVIKKVESTILSLNKRVLWVKVGLKSLGEILFMIKVRLFWDIGGNFKIKIEVKFSED